MSIAYDNSINSTITIGGTNPPTSISYTLGSGSNNLLLVFLQFNKGIDPVSGITYGGVSLTKVDYFCLVPNYAIYGMDCYAGYGLTSGTANVVISWSNSYFSANIVVVSYTGAAQAIPSNFSAAQATQSGGTPVTAAITTINDNSWAGIFEANTYGVADTFTGGTSRQQYTAIRYGDTNGVVHPAGTQNFTMNGYSGNGFGWIAIEIPVAAPTAHPWGFGQVIRRGSY
jgi:hypothetical protein